ARRVVVVRPQRGTEYRLDKEHFTLGRSEDADVSISHSSVSRVHAELFALGNGRFEIVDKASANGIRINGVELKRGILEAGDALELGHLRMRFVGAGEIFRSALDQSQRLAAPGGFDSGAPSTRSPASGKQSGSMGKLLVLGVGVGVALLIAVLMVVRPGSSQTTSGSGPRTGSGQTTSEGAEQLKQAKDKLAAKDVDGAHALILQIPDNS